MEIQLEVINWEEATQLKSWDALYELADSEPATDVVLRGTDAGWNSDSASLHDLIGMELEQAVEEFKNEEIEILQASLLLVICVEGDPTMDLPFEEDECYFLSISPERVKSIQSKLKEIDKNRIIEILEPKLNEYFGEETKKDILYLLNQTETTIEKAASLNRGIVGWRG